MAVPDDQQQGKKASDVDPFAYKAPIPKAVRFGVSLILLGCLAGIFLAGLGLIELPGPVVIFMALGIPASVLAALAILAADRIAWRRSPDYEPGLREAKMEEAVNANPALKFLQGVSKAFSHLSSFLGWMNVGSGFILVALLIWFGLTEWLGAV